MPGATPSGAPIQTGTLISYSILRGARLGSTLRAASVQTDPDYPKKPQGDSLTDCQWPRLAIYATDDGRLAAALALRDMHQQRLRAAGFGDITTPIKPAPAFYYAEEYHQLYIARTSAAIALLAPRALLASSAGPA
jgi:hypothetical protein